MELRAVDALREVRREPLSPRRHVQIRPLNRVHESLVEVREQALRVCDRLQLARVGHVDGVVRQLR